MRRRRRVSRNIGTGGWVGIGVGVVAVGGLAWWLLKRRRQSEAASEAPAAETTSPGIDAAAATISKAAIAFPRLSLRLPTIMGTRLRAA